MLFYFGFYSMSVRDLQSCWPDTDWDKVESPAVIDKDVIVILVDIEELMR